MNRMVHHRAASSKLLVGKPCPVPRWDLAVVIPVDSQDSPELSIFDHAPNCLSRGCKPHWKSGHEANTGLLTGSPNCLVVGNTGGNWLLAQNLALGCRSFFYQLQVMSVFGANQYPVETFREQFVVFRKPPQTIFFGKIAALVRVSMGEPDEIHIPDAFEISLISLRMQMSKTQNTNLNRH